jgi:uncharacterized DUF497 family protein
MDVARFEWDSDKELENFDKHGVDFEEAQLVFADERCIVQRDFAHGESEERYFCIGRTDRGILTVRFTRRGEAVRIIGAGFWRKGKVAYERENSLYR